MKIRKNIINGFVTVILAILLSTNALLAEEESQCSICLKRAQSLIGAAQACMERIASGELSGCKVILAFRGNIQVSISEAERLASVFEQRASEFEKFESEIKEIKVEIERNQRELKRYIDFEKRNEEIEEWVNLSAEAKAEFENTLVDELISTGLMGLKQGMKSIGSIGTGQANKIIGYLKSNGIDIPELNKAIYNFGHVIGKPDMARTATDVVEGLEKARDIYGIAADRSQKLKHLAVVIGWLLNDPRSELLVSEAKILSALIYNGTTRILSTKRINEITKQNEMDLKAINSVTLLLKENVNKLIVLKAEINRIEKCE